MAIVLIIISVSLIIDFLYLYFVCSCVRDGICVVPLTLVVIITRLLLSTLVLGCHLLGVGI